MTQDEIIKLMQQACDPDKKPAWHNGFWTITQEELLRFAALVAAAEREACAKVAEDYKESCYAGDLDWYLAKYIVDEIKARGKE
jgi:hypothetical protein